jgi:hypothetical protein
MFRFLGKILLGLSAILQRLGRYLERAGSQPVPPPPQPPQPIFVDCNPAWQPTGANLVQNGSFELGNFQAATTRTYVSRGNGQRFLDLSAGSGSNAPILGAVFQTANYFQTGQSSPVLRRYQLALDIGVGAPPDHASTVKVNVHVINLALQKVVTYTEPDPPASGVKWRRFSFCFEIPADYVVPVSNHSLEIRGLAGKGFKGVDNVTLYRLT